MNKEELLKEAKRLGITDAETLTFPQLQKAVKSAKEKEKEFELLKERAETLKMDTENVSFEDLKAAVDQEEKRLVKENKRLEIVGTLAEKFAIDTADLDQEDILIMVVDAQAAVLKVLSDKAEILSKYLSIENFEALSTDEIKELLASKKDNEVVVSDKLIDLKESGKTSDSYSAKDGKLYAFTDKTPEVFRFMGALRTQKEWISDKDAMELMVDGNLNYIKTVKKADHEK